jgi:Na+-driven multidrug efflux pump
MEMKIKTLLIINSIVATVFGVLFVIIPDQFLSLYGGDGVVNPQLIYICQLFGAALIGFGLMTWTARDAADSAARKAIVLALFVSDIIGFVVALISQLNNVVNALGWSTVAIYLLLGLGFGYFQFSKTKSSE